MQASPIGLYEAEVAQSRPIRQVGDSAILVEFGARIGSDVLDRVSALDRAIIAARLPGVVETIPCWPIPKSSLHNWRTCEPIQSQHGIARPGDGWFQCSMARPMASISTRWLNGPA